MKNKSIHALRHTFEIYTRLSDQDILAKAPLVHECVKKYLGEWRTQHEV